MSDIYQFNVGGTTYNLANLGLLAPVQITLTADRLYNTGDQFIYTGLLYEATETIAQGTSITIGSNAQLADCVTKQISEINSNLTIQNITVIPAINLSIDGTFKASKTGNIVILNGVTLISSPFSGMNQTLFTLPSNCRPSSQQYIYAISNYGSEGTGQYLLKVNTDGSVVTATGSDTFSSYFAFASAIIVL